MNHFFNYKKYAENYLINIKGINVWLKFDDTFLIIGDIEKCNEPEFNESIRILKRLAFKMGLPHLRFHSSSNTWGENLFKKYENIMTILLYKDTQQYLISEMDKYYMNTAQLNDTAQIQSLTKIRDVY